MPDQEAGVGKKELPVEKATDMELALELVKHIENPCTDQDGNNVRDFYVREAKKAMEAMENPYAKKMLEDKIAEYSKDEPNQHSL